MRAFAVIAAAVAAVAVSSPSSLGMPFGPGGGESGNGSSDSIRLKPVGDATVKSNAPNQNFGNQPTLRLSGGAVVQRAYLRFSLDGDEGGNGVRGATLVVYALTGSDVGFDVRGTTSSWNERSITWANAPAPTPTITASSGPFKAGTKVSVDVTPLFRAGFPVSLVLTTRDTKEIVLASEESDDRDPRVVLDSNHPPHAKDDKLVGQKNTPLAIPVGTLLANDKDPDGDPLTVTKVAGTGDTHGTVVLQGGTVTYTPAPGFNDHAEFKYWVADPYGGTDSADVSVDVRPPDNRNQPPVASNVSATTPEDTAKTVALAAVDPNGQPLTYSIVSAPANGTLGPLNGNTLLYTPKPDYNGTDTFSFKANDGTLDSNVATVTITVTPVNDPPVAKDVSAGTPEDTPVTVALSATDVDSPALTYAVVGKPAHGTAVVNGSQVVYTPALNWNGTDSFTYKANDGSLDSNIATVTITVTPVNDPPVSSNVSASTPEDTAVTVQLSATDVEGAALTYAIVDPPAHGTAVLNGSQVVYTPGLNWNGTDSFTYKANDGSLDSNVATASIAVTPVNDAPVAADVAVRTPEDTPVTFGLVGTDVEGQPLTFAIVAKPAHGTAVVNGSQVVYTPAPNWNGTDSFTYKANDGALDSNVATASITVDPVNDPPVSKDVAATTPEDTAATVQLSATDVDSAVLTYAIVDPPAHGTAVLNGSQVVYTPGPNWNGTDSFTYKANDGSLDSNVATVSITVTPVNDPPVAANVAVHTLEDTPVTFGLVATDVDSPVLTYTLVDKPQHGTFTIGDGGQVTFTPDLNWNGIETFTYKANDGSLDSNIATVTITVDPVNDPPVASDVSAVTKEDVPVTVSLKATDVDSPSLTLSVVGAPAHGTLGPIGADGSVVYTPNAHYRGLDSFTYKANDGSADSNVATVSLEVDAVNHPPSALGLAVTLDQDSSASLTLAGFDPDPGTTLAFAIVGAPGHGTLSAIGADRSVTYTPAAGWSGTDSFTYKASDGSLDSLPATVTLTVRHVNHAPVATDVSVTTKEDTAATVPLKVSDVDGDALTLSLVAGPAHGTAVLNADGSATYTPNPNWSGSDSFTYKANDGTVDSNVATASITVTWVNDPPVVADVDATTDPGKPVVLTLTATDPDTGQTIVFSRVSGPAHGTLSAIGADGKVTYTPSTGFSGDDSFTFKANDGIADSNIGTATIHVRNGPPVAVDDAVSADSNNPLVIQPATLLANDTDPNGDTLSVTGAVATGNTHGSVVLNGDGSITYTADTGYDGSASFTYTISDGKGGTASATVNVTVVYQPQLGTPIRATFYYPWFPESWTQSGLSPFTHYHPSLGFYDSTASNVIQSHIAALQYAKIQVAISSWWGIGHRTDVRFQPLLNASRGTKLRWAVYYEPEGQGDPSIDTLVSDLTYIRNTYGSDRNYLRLGGKIVVFAFAQSTDNCTMADRWKAANARLGNGFYVVLKVFTGFRSCASQPDGWHQYAPANAESDMRPWSFSISPGFWLAKDAAPRLARDPATWSGNVRDMVASGAQFLLVISFNEWGEGTAFENATEWDSASGFGTYADALHNDGLVNGQSPPSATGAATIAYKTARVGEVMTAAATFTGSTPIALTYEWDGCESDGGNCQPLPGETAATHTVTAADVGKTLRVIVTGTNPAGSDKATSIVTGVVASSAKAVASGCGTAAPPAVWTHVIWIWMENKAAQQVIGSGAAPYINALAAACGRVANYAAVTHPSLPNYIAGVSGDTQGVTDDKPPAFHPLTADTIFSQVKAAGLTWRSYQESAPGNCTLVTTGLYLPKHDPATYFTPIRPDCLNWDVPMGSTVAGSFLSDLNNNTLPSFSFVTPNACNDMHDCPVAIGDNWLRTWLPIVLGSSAYQGGTTAIFVTWDENDGSAGNQVATIVISPSTAPGTVSPAATAYTHYSLLRTTEEMFGLTAFLGNAATAPSMRTDFNLG